MKEQEYKIENIKTFELTDIFDCGQCFRWNKEEDGSYTGVFKGNVMNVQKVGDTVTFTPTMAETPGTEALKPTKQVLPVKAQKVSSCL